MAEFKGYLIHLCTHCSTECGGKYCPQCSTAQGRREQDEANDKNLFQAVGKHYICSACNKKQ